MSFTNCLIVMAGGALGTLARYIVSVLALPISDRLPWGTIIINISGSLLIGFFGTFTLAGGGYAASDGLRLFVMIGVCGGYTTFSSFSLQTLDLIRAGGIGRAAVNIAVSVVMCVAAVAVGHLMAAQLNDGAHAIAQSQIEEDG